MPEHPDERLVRAWQQALELGEPTCPGFSDRLHFLLDCANLGIPDRRSGRLQFLIELTGRSRTTVNEWLNRDVPPGKDLRPLVSLLVQHLDGQQRSDLLEAWLLYGDTVVANPLSHRSYQSRKDTVRLATRLIAEVARAHDIEHSSYDFQEVLDQAVALLEQFGLDRYEDVQPGHLRVLLLNLRADKA